MKPDRKRGAVAIEFALLVPVLLMVVLGAIDFGWFFFCQLSVSNAAREGARAGTTVPNGDGAKAQTVAQAYLTSAGLGAQPTAFLVNVGAAPTTVSVEVTMTYQKLINFPPGLLPPTAHARAVMLGVP